MDRFDNVNDTPNYQDSNKLNHTFDTQVGSMYNVSKAIAQQDKKIAKYDDKTGYTKTEVNDLLDAKANADDVYTKTETDDLLDGKANADDVYTKTETDNLLNDKADLFNLEQDFGTKTVTIGVSGTNKVMISTPNSTTTNIWAPNNNIVITAGQSGVPNKNIILTPTGNVICKSVLEFDDGNTAIVPTPTANNHAVPKSYVDNTISIHTLWTGSVTSGEITLSENFSNYNILYFKLVNSNNEINTAVILSEDFNDTSISLPFDIIGKGAQDNRYFNIYKSANNKMAIGSTLNMTLKSVKGGY